MLCTHCSFEWSKLKRVSNLALRNACVRSMGIVWKEFDYSRSSKLVILWHACNMNFQLVDIGWDGHSWNPMLESCFSAFVITTECPSIAFLSKWINKFQLNGAGAESTQWNGRDKTQWDGSYSFYFTLYINIALLYLESSHRKYSLCHHIQL